MGGSVNINNMMNAIKNNIPMRY